VVLKLVMFSCSTICVFGYGYFLYMGSCVLRSSVVDVSAVGGFGCCVVLSRLWGDFGVVMYSVLNLMVYPIVCMCHR